MALAQLTIDLVAKVASFEQDLKRVADSAEKQSSRMQAALGLVKTGLAGLAAGFSVGAIVSFVRTTNDAIDALNDVSDATGSTIENISALENTARRTGGSIDDVGAILVRFNQALGAASPDSPIAAALEAIGLSVDELRRLDPAEALRQTADALSGYADDGNKARLVQELFGRSVQQVAPFLKDLAEQGRLNATVTAEQAEQADKFNKELFKLQTRAQDLARTLASKLVPVLNQLFDDVGSFSEKASLAGLASDVVSFQRQLEALEKRRSSPFNFAGNLDKEIEQTKAKLAEAKRLFNEADVGRPRSAGGGRGFVNPEAVRPDRPSVNLPVEDPEAERRRKEAERLAQQAARDRQREAEEQRREELRVGELRNRLAGEAYREQQQNMEGFEGLLDRINQQEQERLERLLDNTPTRQLERQRQELELLAEAYNAGKLGAVGSAEAVKLYSEAVRELTDQGDKTNEAFKELGLTFSSALEDAIVAGGKAGDMLKGLEQDILRIFTRKFVTQPLANAVSGFDFSSLFSSLFGGFRALGGPVQSGKAYIVGERGPELLIPGSTGRVVPNDMLTRQSGAAAGSMVKVEIVEAPGEGGNTSRRQTSEGDILTVYVEKIKASIAGDIRQGRGMIPESMSSTYGLNRVAGAY